MFQRRSGKVLLAALVVFGVGAVALAAGAGVGTIELGDIKGEGTAAGIELLSYSFGAATEKGKPVCASRSFRFEMKGGTKATEEIEKAMKAGKHFRQATLKFHLDDAHVLQDVGVLEVKKGSAYDRVSLTFSKCLTDHSRRQ